MIQTAARDDDWQVRRLVAGRSTVDRGPCRVGSRPGARFRSAGAPRSDPAIGRLATRTGKCEPIAAFFKDPSPLSRCARWTPLLRPAATSKRGCSVDAEADSLKETASGVGQLEWHLPARALTALARVKPEEARSRLDCRAKHGVLAGSRANRRGRSCGDRPR
jgi:hypothetical protein